MRLTDPKFQKILVVGTSCTGKTTFARKLSGQLQIPHIDLDDLHWLPGWQSRPKDEFAQLIQDNVLSQDAWIVSGNYTSSGRETIWPAATTIIWLRYSLPVVLWRYFRRTYRRVVLKEPCCNGNIETLRTAIFSSDNLFFWILHTHFSRRKKYGRWIRERRFPAEWIILSDHDGSEVLLGQLATAHPAGNSARVQPLHG